MICPNCERESLTRSNAVNWPNWQCDDCGVQFAVLNPAALKPTTHCEECRWFERWKCSKGWPMEFRMPGDDPHDPDAGYHRFECPDYFQES